MAQELVEVELVPLDLQQAIHLEELEDLVLALTLRG
jgi:hypothetical protein